MLCCDAAKADCTIQPTTCVDNFEHPWTSLCLGACRDDPMTLKCVDGPLQHCNQVNFQSPLMYLDDSQKHPRLRRRQKSSQPQERAVAEGLVSGWFCGPTPVPTQFRSWSTISTTASVPGANSSSKNKALQTSSANITNKPTRISSDRDKSSTGIPLDGSFTSNLCDCSTTVLPKPGQSAELSRSGASQAEQNTDTRCVTHCTTETIQPPINDCLSTTSSGDESTPNQTSSSPVATKPAEQDTGTDDNECD